MFPSVLFHEQCPARCGFSVEQDFISWYFQPGQCVLEGKGVCWASQAGTVPWDCSDFVSLPGLRVCEKLLHAIRKHGLLWLNMSSWFL